MSTGLSVAFFGSSLVSAYWNGAATYYRGLISALFRRGHRITFYEPDAFERQSHRDLVTDPPYARVVVYPPDEAGVAHPLLEAREMDVVVKASGVGVLDELLQEAVLAGRRPGPWSSGTSTPPRPSRGCVAIPQTPSSASSRTMI